MSRLTRTIRALILALVLPALLVPSGWSARLCLCGWSAIEQADACCETPRAEAESADEGFESCCASKRGDERAPIATERSGCAQDKSGCGDCCRLVESDSVDLVFANPVQVALPTAELAGEVVSTAEFEPRTLSRIARACTHSLAPPRASTPLPLRI